MTSNRGYIYVLANSAMPDLVKVGKTTRTPSERAAELSKVTGVPTPFIVVYERMVDDCTVAEEFIHSVLQQKGYRESDNREFFRVPVTEVINIIVKMPQQIVSNLDVEDDDSNELFLKNSNDELDEFVLYSETEESNYVWLELWQMAENYNYGLGDFIQDYDEAMRLYKQSIKLGCLVAYAQVGDLFNYGNGVPQNDQKALEWYKEGSKKGDYFCYLKMGDLFSYNDQMDNFHKCYKTFFKNRQEKSNPIVEEFYSNLDYLISCITYINTCLKHNIEPNPEIIQSFSEDKSLISLTLTDKIKQYSSNQELSYQNMAKNYQKTRKWIDENL